MKRILVVGSKGNVGRTLVEELACVGESVRAATRNPGSAKVSKSVEPVVFDYADPGTFEGALDGVDRVFTICPPETAPDAVMIPFLRAAARGRRKVVLMTAMGTEFDENSPLRKVELALEATGTAHVILRPNWFLDNFHTVWLDSIRQAGVISLPAGEARTSFIDARDIAASAAAALRTDHFDGQAFALTGPAARSYADVATVLTKAGGREIRYVAASGEDFVQGMVGAGAPEDLARYLAGLFEAVAAGQTADVSPAVRQLTGREPRTLEKYAETHSAAWK